MTSVNSNSNRRRFLQTVAASGSAFAARSWWSPNLTAAEKRGAASERIRVGVIGTGVRGKYLIGNLPPSAQVVSLCDCATSQIASTLKPRGEFDSVLARFAEGDATGCTMHQDYRRMFDRDKLDAVIIATPDHHHALAGMMAMQAGLDVYLEKPLTLTISEGRQLANMVKRTGRVLQVGSQQRTMEMNRIGCEFVRSGGLGKVYKVELPNYPGPIGEPRLSAETPPDDVDWNLFLGPARLRGYHRKLWMKDAFQVGDLLWRGWDLFRDYAGHIMTNWGAHSVDMVQYALGRDDTGPVEIGALAPDSIEPIWQQWKQKSPAPVDAKERRFWPVVMRYADGVELQFTSDQGAIQFYGERGIMKMRRNHFETDPVDLIKDGPDPQLAEKWQGAGHVARPHLENWLDCIKSRGAPNAPVEVGHRTVTICHLANIARELNRPLRWDPVKERFVDDEPANGLLSRPRRKGFELPA